MIEILQEITEWDSPVKNGTYHINSAGHLVQFNDTIFKAPLKGFSKARRKFKKIGERPDMSMPTMKTVVGSTGKIYVINNGECSCPGFQFRGKCKHIL